MLYMSLLVTNIRNKYIPLSAVQHVEIEIERLLKVAAPRNGGVRSRAGYLDGGDMAVYAL